ncbi:MAG: 1-phosphofructokinase family hexose kinase [Alphaproteobacteria bacterium]|nr:1-phosphofructokinase family hexose kinase [Alphaproteobacteria bacterium]
MQAGRIVTLTLNPALDLASEAERVEPIHKIRTFGDHIDPGGGGINVARVVHALGGDALAVIATGGVTGRYVEDLLSETGVPWHAVPIAGRTRVSLTVLDRASGLEYRFVPKGPTLSRQEWDSTLALMETIDGEWVVASGSLPPGAPPDAYGLLARLAARRGQRFVLDSSGPALRAALGRGIEIVKPSLGELESLVGRRLANAAEQEAEALNLVRSGMARMVVLTLGQQGAIMASADGVIWMPALPEAVQSAVGAGDAFLGSMILALARGASQEEALAWGIAGGAAAIARVGTARVERDEVERRFDRLASLRSGFGARLEPLTRATARFPSVADRPGPE